MNPEFRKVVETVGVAQRGLYEKNSEFNDYYDDLSESTFEGLKPSEILYKCDPTAYDSEYKEWLQNSFDSRFGMTLELLEDDLLKNRVRPLIDVLKKSKVAPFVGAGLSIPCGKKSWQFMLLDIGQRSSRVDQEKFKALVDDEKFIEAADEIAGSSPGQLSEYIKASLADSRPQGAVTSLPDIASECIITSNLDCILETVYRDQDKPFNDGYMYGVHDQNFLHHLVSGGRCLLKLHGDCLNPATQVFTGEQYNDAYGDAEKIDFSKTLPKALRQIFVSNSLLFLGCSLHKDRTLKLFEKVISSGEYHIPDHYAFIEAPADGDTRERDHELAELRIKPIWYPHEQHEYVENFVQFLAAHKSGEAPEL